jgi:four helix bundle protein
MEKKIKSYEDLEVYQRSYQNCLVLIKQFLPQLPKEEKFDLVDQLRRSAKAVPRLIAEGFPKKDQQKGFIRYLSDALTENSETIVGLKQAKDLYGEIVNPTLCNQLLDEYSIIGKQLFRLRESWQKIHGQYKF